MSVHRYSYGVKPYNPTNYAIILAAILLVSAIAVAVPVRRALRIDPLAALRYE
jgi:ABC-type antimicrobial peptide transport system permease subunit